MYRCITEISFQQVTNDRKLAFTFDFVNDFSATNTWVDMTNNCKIRFPKNIYVKDKNGNLLPLGGTQKDKQLQDLFLRGDKISVSFGYWLENGNKSVTKIFEGYISKVVSKKPIELECEDNVWLLKQLAVKRQVVPKNKTINTLLTELLVGTGFTVNTITNITIGEFVIENETVAQLLTRLRKEFHIESFFRGNELRIGLSPYVQSEAVLNTFVFQQNIISDEFDFQRKDDVVLSAVVQSINTVVGETNKKGEAKTKKEQLSVLVYSEKGEFKYLVKKKGEDFPANVEGERRTLFFPNIEDPKKLFELGVAELKKFFYTGFKGKFTTFAYPFVQLGDHVRLIDKLLPDRNGTYVVRGVEYTGGVQGHRQIIQLDYKLIGNE